MKMKKIKIKIAINIKDKHHMMEDKEDKNQKKE